MSTFKRRKTGLEKSLSSGVQNCERECVLDRVRNRDLVLALRNKVLEGYRKKGVVLKQTFH